MISNPLQYQPSTQKLLELLEPDAVWKPQDASEAKDSYPVFAALRDWRDCLWQKITPEDYEHGTWPASPQLLHALRDALKDQVGNNAGDWLAYSLVRCGCRAPETLLGLNPWDSLLFKWHEMKVSAHQVFSKFQAIGAGGNPIDEDFLKIDAWIENPVASLDVAHPVSLLLKGRIITGGLHSDECRPGYSSLFDNMAACSSPVLPVLNVSQKNLNPGFEDITAEMHAELGDEIPDELKGTPILQSKDAVWRIDFELNGARESIYVRGDDTWLNDTGLSLEFDKLLAKQGRPDRVIKFAGERGNRGDPYWGSYVIAEPESFSALCRELGVPLEKFGSLG